MITKWSCYLVVGEYAFLGRSMENRIVIKVLRIQNKFKNPTVVKARIYGHQSIIDGGTLEFEIPDEVEVLNESELALFLMKQ